MPDTKVALNGSKVSALNQIREKGKATEYSLIKTGMARRTAWNTLHSLQKGGLIEPIKEERKIPYVLTEEGRKFMSQRFFVDEVGIHQPTSYKPAEGDRFVVEYGEPKIAFIQNDDSLVSYDAGKSVFQIETGVPTLTGADPGGVSILLLERASDTFFM